MRDLVAGQPRGVTEVVKRILDYIFSYCVMTITIYDDACVLYTCKLGVLWKLKLMKDCVTQVILLRLGFSREERFHNTCSQILKDKVTHFCRTGILMRFFLKNRGAVIVIERGENDKCPICYDIFDSDTDYAIILWCQHIFCKPCLAAWLNTE